MQNYIKLIIVLYICVINFILLILLFIYNLIVNMIIVYIPIPLNLHNILLIFFGETSYHHIEEGNILYSSNLGILHNKMIVYHKNA